MEAILLILGLSIAVVLIMAFFAIYKSFTYGLLLMKFWSWFIVPVFTTLPLLDYWQSVGIVMFLCIFNNYSKVSDIKEEYVDKQKKKIINVMIIITPWVLLLIGFLMKLIIK